MNNYILHLKSNRHEEFSVELSQKSDLEKLYDYQSEIHDYVVYNDDDYDFKVTVNNNIVYISAFYINGEYFDTSKDKKAFLECFGVAKIEVEICGNLYVTPNFSIMINKDNVHKGILNMIDFIYDNCDDYLYEEHRNSKKAFGIKHNEHISIDSKLRLLDDICNNYEQCFNIFRASANTKLISIDRIGDFSNLQTISQNTIRHIVIHPEELKAVGYNTGIKYNNQYYQPQNTIINSVDYSYDIYENRVIVGFLKTIIDELNGMRKTIEIHKNQFHVYRTQNQYIKSSYYIYSRNNRILSEYLSTIDILIVKFQKILLMYKALFKINPDRIYNQPKYSNIFRRVRPYRIIFENIISWFNCGNYDLSKSDLLLSFMSVSRIYECFCLIKLCKTFEKMGFSKSFGIAYKYNESKYYQNTIHNNTFVFEKDDTLITLYYQPVVSGKRTDIMNPKNKLNLYRNTSTSIHYGYTTFQDEAYVINGNFYTPDYVIKIERNNEAKYYVMDAKHSTINNIEKHQLPYLVFKYLFSISTIKDEDTLSGICILCGKEDQSYSQNIKNNTIVLEKQQLPSAYFIGVSGIDCDNYNPLINLLKSYLED